MSEVIYWCAVAVLTIGLVLLTTDLGLSWLNWAGLTMFVVGFGVVNFMVLRNK